MCITYIHAQVLNRCCFSLTTMATLVIVIICLVLQTFSLIIVQLTKIILGLLVYS